MTFETMGDMLKELSQYRVYKNRYEALEHDMKGVKSPRLSDEPTGSPVSKETRYNENIEEREDLAQRMADIKDLLASIKDIDYLSYIILYDKFVLFLTLEQICPRIGYSLDHMKHYLYPHAKDVLFENHTQSHLDE